MPQNVVSGEGGRSGFSPPCSRAVCPSSKHTTTSFEHTTELVAMYQFEATDDPSSKHSDQITQQHTPDGRGISEHTDLIWERAVTLIFRFAGPFCTPVEAAGFVPCPFWQVPEILQILPGLNSIFASRSNKVWRTWRDIKVHENNILLLFFLTVLGIFLSFPNRLWESDKRVPRTNNCSRKRMNNSI